MHKPSAIAIVAHPDDIEFQMAGTLLRLKEAGWEIHYFNLASGNGGCMEFDSSKISQIRRNEAQEAASILGAHWHAPICNDLEIFYHDGLLRQVAAVIRKVKPSIVLTHALQDYMEDHTNTARLAVTAAFAHCIKNYETTPSQPAYYEDVTVYHCMPHGGRDPLRRRVIPGAWVDTTSVHAQAMEALKAHRSQHGWLDSSQGMNNYLRVMEERSREMGTLSGVFELADGWHRHLHLGFSATDSDPLAEALGAHYLINTAFEQSLN